MSRDDPIAGVDTTRRWMATGGREIRIKRLHKRHKQLVGLLKEDIDANSNREAIAALLEYYHDHPEKVRRHAEGVKFR